MTFPDLVIPKKLFLSHSCASTFLTCRRKWLLKYLALLSAKKLSIHLFIGKWFHKGAEEFYSGGDPQVFVPLIIKGMEEEARAAVFTTPEEEESLLWATAVVEGALYAYAKWYRKDRKKWKIIKPEFEFKVRMDGKYYYVGIIDLLIEIDGELWILETKTAGRLDSNYLARLPIDTQVTGYYGGAKDVMNRPIKGIIYNVIKKPQLRGKKGESKLQLAKRIKEDYLARPEFYFYRQKLKRKQRHLDQYNAELFFIAADIYRGLALLKEDWKAALPYFYRNTKACSNMGLCEFLDICVKGWKNSAYKYEVRDAFNPEFQADKTED